MGSESRRYASSRPPLGTINVIFVAPGMTGSYPFRVLSVAWLSVEGPNSKPKRARMSIQPVLSFSDVKRVMVDQDNGAEIMYSDLYRELNLKPEDLTTYNSPLVSFDGKVVIPRGQIRLPVQADSKVAKVDFIVVDAYSPYTAIMARPWLHALGAVSSTLHQNVKYPSGGRLKSLLGVSPRLGNAWWLSSFISLKLNPQPL